MRNVGVIISAAVRTFNLCLLGFGNVGRSLAWLLSSKTDELRERYGIEWRITGAATRRMGWIVDPNGLDVIALLAGKVAGAGTAREKHATRSYVGGDDVGADYIRDWLKAARADVMFEITSLDPATGQPAIDYIRAALEHGAHAVTANKGPVVHAYRELRDLAAAKGKRFMFEATVMGGAPVFSLFRETLPGANLLGFRGLLNSTSNLIITEMESGRTFDRAVKKAQDIGLAETDPSNDVDGWDASVKVSALATVLMDAPLKPQAVQREGIRGLTPEVVSQARADGMPFKLVCRLTRENGRVAASVRPEQIPVSDPLASVRGASSIAHFDIDTLPSGLTLISHDPGPDTTAYDMMADFVNAVRN